MNKSKLIFFHKNSSNLRYLANESVKLHDKSIGNNINFDEGCVDYETEENNRPASLEIVIDNEYVGDIIMIAIKIPKIIIKKKDVTIDE